MKLLAVVMILINLTMVQADGYVQCTSSKGCAGKGGPNIPINKDGSVYLTPYVQGNTKQGVTGGGMALTIKFR